MRSFIFILVIVIIGYQCKPTDSNSSSVGEALNDTLVFASGDERKYIPDGPLDAWAKLWGLDTLDRDEESFGFRVWLSREPGLTVITVQSKGDIHRCNVKTFKSISRDTVIVRGNTLVTRPFSGWAPFVDSLRRFRVPSSNPKPLYFSYAMLTGADGVEIEQVANGVYRYRKYLQPELYRHVIYEAMEATDLLNFLSFELGLNLNQHGWGDQFVDQRTAGLDSEFQANPLYQMNRDDLKNECSQEIGFLEAPKSVSLFTTFYCDVSNFSDQLLEFYVGVDQYWHGQWRASFLDVDGRSPRDSNSIQVVEVADSKRVFYHDIFASFGMGPNFRYLLDGEYRLVIYYRRKGEVSFKRCAGNRIDIRNRVDISKGMMPVKSVFLDTIFHN